MTRFLQVARKEANLELTDRIVLDFAGTDTKVLELVETYKDKIMAETLTVAITKVSNPVIKKEFELGQGKVVVQIAKA